MPDSSCFCHLETGSPVALGSLSAEVGTELLTSSFHFSRAAVCDVIIHWMPSHLVYRVQGIKLPAKPHLFVFGTGGFPVGIGN